LHGLSATTELLVPTTDHTSVRHAEPCSQIFVEHHASVLEAKQCSWCISVIRTSAVLRFYQNTHDRPTHVFSDYIAQ